MSSQQNSKKILIVGAGPTGLTAAFELARRGIIPQVIDGKTGVAPQSRAVGINARTLELLEAADVTPRLLAEGVKVKHSQIMMEGKECTNIDFGILPHKYNYLLSLPQDRTETIMQKRFEEFGGNVRYQTTLISLKKNKDGTVDAVMDKNGQRLTETFNAVIGADGVNSRVRQEIKVKTEGKDYPNNWSAAEFESKDWPHPAEDAQYFLKENGNFAAVIPLGKGRFRVASNTSDAMACIPGQFTIDKMHNTSTYKIVIRHVKKYQKGNIFLAGDAAHTFSPAGGRGMNLGIEDACSLAARIADGKTKGYSRERRPAGKATIRDSERLVYIAELQNPFLKAVRNKVVPTAMRIKPIEKMIVKKSFGL